VRHHNSVFHDLLKWVPWDRFEQLTAAHQADRRVWRLPTKRQFIALLCGQLSGASSLREIVAGLKSHAARLYHVGGRTVSRSTLADANAVRPSAVFGALFTAMVAGAGPGLRRAVGEATYLIASTSIRLTGVAAAWARFSANACGAKAHVIYDPHADWPIYAAVSPVDVNDITAAQQRALGSDLHEIGRDLEAVEAECIGDACAKRLRRQSGDVVVGLKICSEKASPLWPTVASAFTVPRSAARRAPRSGPGRAVRCPRRRPVSA
jgi:hypothetical protein